MRPYCLLAVLFGGCNLLTDYDTGFLPEPADAGEADADADGDADGDADSDGDGDGDADAGPPPCSIAGGPTETDSSAPLGDDPAVAPFEEELAVAYIGPLEGEWAQLQVRLGTCDALDGETVDMEEVGAATADGTRPDAAWNPATSTFGVAWADGIANEFAKWRTIHRGAAGLERSTPRYLAPGYEPVSAFDLRWPRVSVADGEWIVLLPDVADSDRRVTVQRFPGDPWPPNVELDVFPFAGSNELLAPGISDIVGRAAAGEYHMAFALGAPPSLYSADYLVASAIARGSRPLLGNVAAVRTAAMTDPLPNGFGDATPTALVALDQSRALHLVYPDISEDPSLTIDGATHVTDFDAVAIGTLLVVSWVENPDDGPPEVRVAVARVNQGEVIAQSRAMSIATASELGVRGLSAAVVSGDRIAVAWAEPDANELNRVRVACLECSPP